MTRRNPARAYTRGRPPSIPRRMAGGSAAATFTPVPPVAVPPGRAGGAGAARTAARKVLEPGQRRSCARRVTCARYALFPKILPYTNT